MNHKEAFVTLFCLDEGDEGGKIRILAEPGITVAGLLAAGDELFYGNDIEGASIGIAAIMETYPNHNADEYWEPVSGILDLCCPLLRLQTEMANFPDGLQLKVDEMFNMIFDGAARITAGQAVI